MSSILVASNKPCRNPVFVVEPVNTCAIQESGCINKFMLELLRFVYEISMIVTF